MVSRSKYDPYLWEHARPEFEHVLSEACRSMVLGLAPRSLYLIRSVVVTLVVLVSASCSQQAGQLAGRWELGFEGEAVEVGRYEMLLGSEVVSIPVAHGDTAQIVRDRLVAALGDSGYRMDCLWHEPSQAVVIANGTSIPRGEEYFALVDLPGEPDILQSPLGVSMVVGGPRETRQLEERGARRKANQWIDDLSETFNSLPTRHLGSITQDPSLLLLLEGLRKEGLSLEPGTVSDVAVDCNHAVVRFEGGSIEGLTLEKGYYEGWRVARVHLLE